MYEKIDLTDIKKLGKSELSDLLELVTGQNNMLLNERDELEQRARGAENRAKLLERERTKLIGQISNLQKKLKVVKGKLDSQKTTTSEFSWIHRGSLAEYAVKVNHILESAQQAADVYLSEVIKRNEEKEQEAELLISSAKKEADDILSAALEKRAGLEHSSGIIVENLQSEIDRLLDGFKEEYQELYDLADEKNIFT